MEGILDILDGANLDFDLLLTHILPQNIDTHLYFRELKYQLAVSDLRQSTIPHHSHDSLVLLS